MLEKNAKCECKYAICTRKYVICTHWLSRLLWPMFGKCCREIVRIGIKRDEEYGEKCTRFCFKCHTDKSNSCNFGILHTKLTLTLLYGLISFKSRNIKQSMSTTKSISLERWDFYFLNHINRLAFTVHSLHAILNCWNHNLTRKRTREKHTTSWQRTE